jgi:LITAF-like zinc ribbon domain
VLRCLLRRRRRRRSNHGSGFENIENNIPFLVLNSFLPSSTFTSLGGPGGTFSTKTTTTMKNSIHPSHPIPSIQTASSKRNDHNDFKEQAQYENLPVARAVASIEDGPTAPSALYDDDVEPQLHYQTRQQQQQIQVPQRGIPAVAVAVAVAVAPAPAPAPVTAARQNEDLFLLRQQQQQQQQQQESRTQVRTYPSCATWTAAGGLFLVFWPLCWLPLVVDQMKQTDHYCVLCGGLVCEVKAFQDCCVETRS